MSFTIYEVIAHIVPGYIVIFLIRNKIGVEVKDLSSLGILALAYAIGYVVQTIASWTEGIMYFTWGGKPSTQLLNGKNTWKVKLNTWQYVKQLLTQEAEANENTVVSEDLLFEIAQRKVNAQKYERVVTFNAVYALSRAMTISFLVATVLSFYFGLLDWRLRGILIILVVISWYRSKQRGFYYAKEVLNMYLVSTNDS